MHFKQTFHIFTFQKFFLVVVVVMDSPKKMRFHLHQSFAWIKMPDCVLISLYKLNNNDNNHHRRRQ